MFSNDIALIKIRRKGDGAGIRFSEMISPACLPSPDTPQEPGTDCVISGWGKIDRKFVKQSYMYKPISQLDIFTEITFTDNLHKNITFSTSHFRKVFP